MSYYAKFGRDVMMDISTGSVIFRTLPVSLGKKIIGNNLENAFFLKLGEKLSH